MNHLCAFYESLDGGGVLQNIAAVPDQSVFTSGDDVRVPKDLPFIIGEVGLTASTTVSAAELTSPALRSIANLQIEPVLGAVVFGSPPEAMMHPFSPVPVVGDEAINFQFNTDNTGAAVHWGLVWFGDGVQQPVTGEIYSVRCTAAASLSAGNWVNSNLTFSQVLPKGTYAVVGMRARGTNLVSARLVFVGGTWRPGVPAVNAIGDLDADFFRYGRMGTFGTFDTNTPPTVDCLGVTDSSQTIILDLIKLS